MGLNKWGHLFDPNFADNIWSQTPSPWQPPVATKVNGRRPPRHVFDGKGAQAMLCDRVVEVRMHVLECDLDDSVVRHSHAFRGSRLY